MIVVSVLVAAVCGAALKAPQESSKEEFMDGDAIDEMFVQDEQAELKKAAVEKGSWDEGKEAVIEDFIQAHSSKAPSSPITQGITTPAEKEKVPFFEKKEAVVPEQAVETKAKTTIPSPPISDHQDIHGAASHTAEHTTLAAITIATVAAVVFV